MHCIWNTSGQSPRESHKGRRVSANNQEGQCLVGTSPVPMKKKLRKVLISFKFRTDEMCALTNLSDSSLLMHFRGHLNSESVKCLSYLQFKDSKQRVSAENKVETDHCNERTPQMISDFQSHSVARMVPIQQISSHFSDQC